MHIRYNENKELVAQIQEGLRRKEGYCPCRLERTPDVCAKSSGIRLQIPILKAIVIACFTIKAKIEKEEKP